MRPCSITGESGTGKELVARALHRLGAARSAARSSRVNCAALPETLLESELFGHERGAFTDARARAPRPASSRPSGGTLFLDEIGELPLALQPKLLRALQERTRAPARRRRARCPSTCASSPPPTATSRPRSRSGRFREDLFYRLNVVPHRAAAAARARRRRARSSRSTSCAQLAARSGKPRDRASRRGRGRAAPRLRLARQRPRARRTASSARSRSRATSRSSSRICRNGSATIGSATCSSRATDPQSWSRSRRSSGATSLRVMEAVRRQQDAGRAHPGTRSQDPVSEARAHREASQLIARTARGENPRESERAGPRSGARRRATSALARALHWTLGGASLRGTREGEPCCPRT